MKHFKTPQEAEAFHLGFITATSFSQLLQMMPVPDFAHKKLQFNIFENVYGDSGPSVDIGPLVADLINNIFEDDTLWNGAASGWSADQCRSVLRGPLGDLKPELEALLSGKTKERISMLKTRAEEGSGKIFNDEQLKYFAAGMLMQVGLMKMMEMGDMDLPTLDETKVCSAMLTALKATPTADIEDIMSAAKNKLMSGMDSMRIDFPADATPEVREGMIADKLMEVGRSTLEGKGAALAAAEEVYREYKAGNLSFVDFITGMETIGKAYGLTVKVVGVKNEFFNPPTGGTSGGNPGGWVC